MDLIVLSNQSSDQKPLQAIFDPDRGMNLLSYKRGEIEVIDQSTRPLFEERFAGLGALIGPHFHHRHPPTIPAVKDESLFPHIARVKSKGVVEPFSHGIARYAPWQVEATPSSVSGRLTGKDTWNGVPLAELEGQNFTMAFKAELKAEGLQLDLSVVSDSDSIVGIHYYYNLPQGKGTVTAQSQNSYIEKGERKSLPEKWPLDEQHRLTLDLHHAFDQAFDATFFPFPDPCAAKIILDAGSYRLVTHYRSPSQENSWQLYHPVGASFVCIEPLSSQDPRHPNLTVSSLSILLQIESLS